MTATTTVDASYEADFAKSVTSGKYRQLELIDADEAFTEALELDNRNRRRRNMAYQHGRGQGAIERERYSFTVQPCKPRNQKLARFETLATIMVGVCLYALVIAALLHVIAAAR